MGYYIQTNRNHGKAEDIAKEYGGFILPNAPKNYADIPADKALIVVVDNGPFEAAAFAYDAEEFSVFTDREDDRPKQYVLIDREAAELASGFRKEPKPGVVG